MISDNFEESSFIDVVRGKSQLEQKREMWQYQIQIVSFWGFLLLGKPENSVRYYFLRLIYTTDARGERKSQKIP